MTSVKIIAAPEGISRKYDINNPEIVPVNANIVDKTSNFLKSLVNKFADACGMVSSERMRIMPTTRIFSTTVKEISIMVR